MVRPARSIVLRRTAPGRRAEPAIVSDGQASQARLVRKTVACEQTLLPIWHGITAVQVRATITATAHISADLYGANPTMWRRPRMLSKSGGATSDAILALFGSIRTPTVRTTVPRAQNRPLNWTFMWWCRLGSNQCPSACEAAVNAADLRRKHFHALNGKRLTCFDAYESLLHRT